MLHAFILFKLSGVPASQSLVPSATPPNVTQRVANRPSTAAEESQTPAAPVPQQQQQNRRNRRNARLWLRQSGRSGLLLWWTLLAEQRYTPPH